MLGSEPRVLFMFSKCLIPPLPVCFLFIFVYLRQGLKYRSAWLGIHYVDQVGFELAERSTCLCLYWD